MIKIADIAEDQFLAYDIETTSVYAPYTELKMVGYQLGLNSQPQLLNLEDKDECEEFRRWLLDPDVIKVNYNGINFDDIVLFRFGFYVEPSNRHDLFLALKTVAPSLPAYSLKFANWHYFADWHEPERRLHAWLKHHKLKMAQMWQAPVEVLGEYCKYDVYETVQIFRLIWEVVQRPLHWNTYRQMELAMGEPLLEMVLLSGEFIDLADTQARIVKLQEERTKINAKVINLSKGRITNAGSSPQVSQYLHEIDQVELEWSDKGNLMVRKSDLLELLPTNPIAKAVYEFRDISKVIEHFRSYYNAAEHERNKRINHPGSNGQLRPLDYTSSVAQRGHRFGHNGNQAVYRTSEAIPKGYTVSSARTRRFKSGSQFGINFQNQNKRTKVIQRVPPGWLGLWLDSTQIENVVHIWASKDEARRQSYEADVNWNEYVWLTNVVMGTDYTRAELEAIASEFNPNISVYKAYKQIKLALNFGMGIPKFAKRTGLTKREAALQFAQVHRACPAIHQLGEILKEQVRQDGHIRDPFGHIYTGDIRDSNKLIAYFIQGCGTGSVPKAMTIANYETLHQFDSDHCLYLPAIRHPYTRRYQFAVLCGSTHDECALRVSLGLPANQIIKLIRECLYNMEERFSDHFDGIPLRAKLAISITNAAEQEEINHHAHDFESNLFQYIRAGQRQFSHLALDRPQHA